MKVWIKEFGNVKYSKVVIYWKKEIMHRPFISMENIEDGDIIIVSKEDRALDGVRYSRIYYFEIRLPQSHWL